MSDERIMSVFMKDAAAGSIEAVVCIPTFLRPQLLQQTLASLKAQQTKYHFALVIVDNDPVGREGYALAQAFLQETGLCGVVALEPRQGNCHAINAAFALARSQFPQARYDLMIDDDETACPDWLERMITTAKTQQTACVGAPVFPVFVPQAPAFAPLHPAFQTPYQVSMRVPLLYGSGNMLVDRRVWARLDTPEFDVRFNFLGGGDTDFFARCQRAGLDFAWDQEAVIHESVPMERLSFGWLLRRGLRIGAINYALEVKADPSFMGGLRRGLKNCVILGLSFPRGFRLFLRTRSGTCAVHPLWVALGRILAGFGVEPHPYKAKS